MKKTLIFLVELAFGCVVPWRLPLSMFRFQYCEYCASWIRLQRWKAKRRQFLHSSENQFNCNLARESLKSAIIFSYILMLGYCGWTADGPWAGWWDGWPDPGRWCRWAWPGSAGGCARSWSSCRCRAACWRWCGRACRTWIRGTCACGCCGLLPRTRNPYVHGNINVVTITLR